MPVTNVSIPALLQERAEQLAHTVAFTFIDYEQDPAGFAERLTWQQLFRRARILAEELALYGSPGDRVVISAPQGLEYVVAFFGTLQAGFIAVPLSTPQFGAHDDRISSVLRDSQPVAILTTSAVVHDVARYASAQDGRPAPLVIEVDLLDLDSPSELPPSRQCAAGAAYLQYTSGSTRTPAGVVVSHKNVIANVTQSLYAYFGHPAQVPPVTIVSWLPLYHDMGLVLGVFLPLVTGRSAVLLSPTSFLLAPTRWMQLLAKNTRSFTAAPNFAFELAVRRTTDDDMAGLDLGGVYAIANGSERVHAGTLQRFAERFARFNLCPTSIRPSYGLAEATLYVATSEIGLPPKTVRFDYESLTAGLARPCGTERSIGTALVSYGSPDPSSVQIVDPETMTQNRAGTVGEIWVHGDHVAMGYWRKPEHTARIFEAELVEPAPGVPAGPWLRTGDLGVISDGELFIIGRIKDLLIVDGRNHYPDDIEATIQEITHGRVAAISVPDDITEHLVAIIELKRRASSKGRGDSEDEEKVKLRSVKREVTSAVSKSHSLRVDDLVLVPPGSIPITTSGKVRRSACVERYRSDEFIRLDVSV